MKELKVLILFFLIVIFHSCDTISQDVVPLGDAEEDIPSNLLEGGLYYALTDDQIVFDLVDIPNLSGAVKYTIVNRPALGKVEFVGQTLISYTPDTTKNYREDSFVLKGTWSNNRSLTDTIVLKMVDSVVELPCNAGSMADEYTISINKPLLINVLGNDRFCNVNIDSLSLSLSVKPKLGKAELKGNKVLYTPNLNVKGTDIFIYKVCSTGKNAKCRFAAVKVNIVEDATICKTAIVPDAFLWTRQVGIAEYQMDVLKNDKLCETYKLGKLKVSAAPKFGKTTVMSDNKINYVASSNNVLLDGFEYQICDDQGKNCLKSFVILTVITPPVCKTTIKEDQVGVSLARLPASNEIEIPVLANDKVCEVISTLLVSTQPKTGTVRIDGKKLYYKPKVGTIGSDSFNYQVVTTNLAAKYIGEVSIKIVK